MTSYCAVSKGEYDAAIGYEHLIADLTDGRVGSRSAESKQAWLCSRSIADFPEVESVKNDEPSGMWTLFQDFYD